MYKEIICAGTLLSAISMTAGESVFSTSFAQGKWNAADWQIVKSWRFNHFGKWTQKADCIENEYPADATEKELLGKRAWEAYSTLILNRDFSGSLLISSEMEFNDRMAPGIIIPTAPYATTQDGKLELRDHVEVILYDEGINIWHHYFVDGKQEWRKLAYLYTTDFKKQTRYTVNVAIKDTKRGKEMSVQVGGHTFGCLIPDMPDKYRIGIVGCEGINRFYDFKAEKIQDKK